MSPNYYDANEEYVCGYCLKPVDEKYLYCSEECSEADSEQKDDDYVTI